ncbi:hypothetical protein RZS08_28635, partial [Arthrospira platensis SPKY1]|nr:hypothetical protein [Arthrospira platensis SPKY1]
RKLFSFNPSVPQLYSNSADEVQLAINAIPEISKDASIPLGMYIPIEGQYYMRLMPKTSTLTESVVLEDLKMGIQINLTESEVYDFIASPDDNPNRFVLHFGALSINDNPNQLAATAYVHGGQL